MGVEEEYPREMPRKRTGPASPANELLAGKGVLFDPGSSSAVPMTTSPAFDLWLERQMKILIAACDHTPDQKLIDLIHRELGKREVKITE
jgi:hypothetical protein